MYLNWVLLVARWEDDDRSVHDAQPAMIDTSITGEEAYARRLAMSQGIVPAVPAPPAAPPREETGDEAYQRRLALSQGLSTSISQPEPIKATSPEPEKTLSYNPFAPSFVPPPPPAPAPNPGPSSVLDADFEARLKHSRDAAAAVAARLAKLASASAEEGSTAGNEPSTQSKEEEKET